MKSCDFIKFIAFQGPKIDVQKKLFVNNSFIEKKMRFDSQKSRNKFISINLIYRILGGELGSADTLRDPRGFAIKFYTEDGNWDLVGNNTPVFFIRDPILFPSFIHTQKRNPVTHLKVNSISPLIFPQI